MKPGWMVVTIVIAMVAATSAAHAQSAATSPGFVTMDRFDATSRAGIELSYLFPNLPANTSLTGLRFDAHGQYVDPHSGFGAYLQMPFSYISGNNQSETGIGDLEVGGIFVPRLTTPNAALVLHAGLTLPTASTSTAGADANLVGELVRLTDFYDFVPHGLSLRIGVSPIVRSGNLFARLDLGFDGNISSTVNVESLLRVNVGGGVDLGNFALMAEFINLHSNRNTSSASDQWINEAAISARFRSGSVQPYLAIVLPLDHDSHLLLDAALTFGIEGLIR